MENLLIGFASGLGVWFFVYGLNRTYLTVKSFLS